MFEEVQTRHNFSEAKFETPPKGLPRCVTFIVQKRINVTFYGCLLQVFSIPNFPSSRPQKNSSFPLLRRCLLLGLNIFPSPNIFHSILLFYGLKVSSSTERKMYFECTKTHFLSVKMQICGHMSKL